MHRFFEQWFAGTLPDQAFDSFLDRFSDAFEMVTPAGTSVSKEGLGSMRGQKGSNTQWRIYIREMQLGVVPSSGNRIVSGTYRELQQGAQNGAVAGTNGRLSSPLLELDESVQPNGVRWLRLHETWLPEAVLSAFDWGAAQSTSEVAPPNPAM